MDIKTYVCVPAYGRDYATVEEVKEAWKAGKDFQIRSIDRMNGRYFNIHDADANGLSAQIRYNSQRDVYVWPEPALNEDETAAEIEVE